MIETILRDEIQSALLAVYNHHLKTDEIVIEQPSDSKNGDYSTNISFKLAPIIKSSPAEIATKIAAKMAELSYFREVKAVSGFINFYLNPELYHKNLAEIIKAKGDYGKSDIFKGKKFQFEFISANPTGPLTLANGRGGFAGDALANVFTWAGAKVEREYYVNDGGNQVRILGLSVLAAVGKYQGDEDIYRGEYIAEWAKKNNKIVLKEADNPFRLGQLMAADLLSDQIKPSTERMGIKFDNWFSEAAMIERGEVDEAIEKLTESGHTKEADGALWMKTTEFGDDKDRVLQKSDGVRTYFAADVAYHYDKFSLRKFDRVIDIWGADHHGYIGRMMAAVSAMGYQGSLSVIITQMVRLIKGGKEYKMSKRAGTYVTMDDLLDMIGGPDAADVARYFFLSRSFNTHMDFDLDLAKDRSEKNPVFYVKYARARIHGIIANADESWLNSKPDLSLLTATEELNLIAELANLPAVIASVCFADDWPIHQLTFYANNLARKFHLFYDKCRVINENDPELTTARLALASATEKVLLIVGEKLIGISLPEKM